jgi:hypothetical protein
MNLVLVNASDEVKAA